MSERFNSVKDIAELLQVDEQTVRRWIKEGRLAAVKLGLEWRVRQTDLDEFLEARSTPKKAPAPPSLPEQASFNDLLREDIEERRVIERLLHPWVGWLERDAAYLTEVRHAGRVDRGAHEKILADRQNTLQALDDLGTALERLGIDWMDERNRALRRARRDIQAAFDDWTDARLEARTTYLDSLAGSELAQARRAQDEEEERSGNMPKWLQEAS
jgi:excisionase family DNA binding protein